ncbi:KIR protein [Plasmodium coatneyi]|uniref:KIR protein n=1 Tax=Plasmodium coatneyi TaxID=208452 RepID=A0A1B1E7X1_9APIC|nr:KIR protein [Plasmodium coatneyi]ANQ11088.1 KIR protein [Plasmodium coatneyi]
MPELGLEEKSLPSYKEFYHKFENTTEKECGDGRGKFQNWGSDLKTELTTYDKLSISAEKIAGALCSACKNNGCINSKGASCTFFYYWLGIKFFETSDPSKFPPFIEAIYDALEKTFYEKQCNVNYKDVNKLLFELRKDV